jgi:hypothetical protein
VQFGQVLRFFEFEWRHETLHVAVVQPWTSREWLPVREDVYPNAPRQLVSPIHRLQAFDVRALRHVAGRVPILDSGGAHVLFETSLGNLLPEMFE